MSDHTNTSDDYEEELSKRQGLLAKQVLEHLDHEKNDPLVWVNTYVMFEPEVFEFEGDESVPKFDEIDPHLAYIYEHTAINEDDDRSVESVERLIDNTISDSGNRPDSEEEDHGDELEKKSLTETIHNDWDEILHEGDRLVSFIVKRDDKPRLCICEDGKIEEAFKSESSKFQWYTEIFKNTWEKGRYIHIHPPNLDHLPIEKAGVYLMIRERGVLRDFHLRILELAFRSFLLETMTARAWGIAEGRRQVLIERNRELRRKTAIYEKIKGSLDDLEKSFSEARSSMREIDAVLPLSIDGFLFRGDTIPPYYSGTGNSKPFNESIDVESRHNFNKGKKLRCRKIAAATLLTALKQAGNDVKKPLWYHLSDILDSPPEDDEELERAADALERVLPEVTEKINDADAIEHSFEKIKRWFNYAYRREQQLCPSHLYLALCMFTGDSPDCVSLGDGVRNGVKMKDEWSLSTCSEKPIESLEALHLLDQDYDFEEAECLLNENKLLVELTHSPQEQTRKRLMGALEKLEKADDKIGTGHEDVETFTMILWKLFGKESGEYRPQQVRTKGDWLVLSSSDFDDLSSVDHDTQLHLKKGENSCKTKVIWRKLD